MAYPHGRLRHSCFFHRTAVPEPSTPLQQSRPSPVHTLFRKQNYRNIRLEQDTENETVGVLTRDGKAHPVRWLGFIDRAEAKQIRGRPVKLVISRVGRIDLEPGQYVQGCLVEGGVYAVTDSQVAVVSS